MHFATVRLAGPLGVVNGDLLGTPAGSTSAGPTGGIYLSTVTTTAGGARVLAAFGADALLVMLALCWTSKQLPGHHTEVAFRFWLSFMATVTLGIADVWGTLAQIR